MGEVNICTTYATSNRIGFGSSSYFRSDVIYDSNYAACRLWTEAGRKQSLKTAEAGLWRSAINYLTLIWYNQDGLHGPDVCVLGQPVKCTLSLSEQTASLDALYNLQRTCLSCLH
jgi:hypothetical protein